eukprot:CAMPEP_0181123216 /NCGR_PEP_ID=MMETSP1071-20121207/25767_1 /TAXON_ID=35127 /ORGANISM="Thalassiosira sp., Strain NH16" /LENGTH=530 /DNA_ID=CAMNT_0023208315 /DNA_START=146 /DNA_END=1738 /DNA_ORIENTATION=-
MRTISLLPLQLLSGLLLLHIATTTSAQKIVIHEIQDAQTQFHEIEHASDTPFLSATLKTEISSVPSAITAGQRASLSESLVRFLQRVFDDQRVYDVGVVGVAIFEEQILSLEEAGGRRNLVLNSLQNAQFHFDEDYNHDDDYDDDDEDADDDDEKDWDEMDNLVEEKRSAGGGYALRFAAVVSAEHTGQQVLSHGDFQTMLIHICHKFEDHLIEFVGGIDDTYFGDVERVAVSGYEDDWTEEANTKNNRGAGGEVGVGVGDLGSESENGGLKFRADIFDNEDADDGMEMMPRSESKRMDAAAISGIIVLSCLLLVPLAFAAVKFYRKEQRLKANRWRTQEILTANQNSTIKSLRVLHKNPRDDDYSFNPLGTDNGYNCEDIPRFSDRVEESSLPKDGSSGRDVETVSFSNRSSFPTTSLLFQQPSADDDIPGDASLTKAAPPPPPEVDQYQHVYAPPGKVGVAIDVVNGNPIVHKVKRGSPLEGLLRPNDMVMAIDDVDTTCMSAADVTHLMVKRMNYQRKITFVRKEDA